MCDLAEMVDMSQSALSHGLRLLRTAGVVTHRRDGRMMRYRLADSHVRMRLDAAYMVVELVTGFVTGSWRSPWLHVRQHPTKYSPLGLLPFWPDHQCRVSVKTAELQFTESGKPISPSQTTKNGFSVIVMIVVGAAVAMMALAAAAWRARDKSLGQSARTGPDRRPGEVDGQN